MRSHSRHQSVLKVLVAFAIVSTALHFTHNFVEVDRYPRSESISAGAIQVAILVSWPVFTALALLALRLYSRRRYAPAHALLLGYGAFAATSLGHFLDGSPDVAAFWYATIFTDALAGLAIVAFTAVSIRASAGGRAPRSAAG